MGSLVPRPSGRAGVLHEFARLYALVALPLGAGGRHPCAGTRAKVTPVGAAGASQVSDQLLLYKPLFCLLSLEQ